MASFEGASPSYISAHSADVILSEIRPIKLKIDALHSINVFLDEFLFNILKTACSLLTDKLRASLLKLLPTTLGKEALLEAEVELRAYWDRTGTPDACTSRDDSETFDVQWAFSLLRLKCEAYSTLNESDEDQAAENTVNEKICAAGGTPPNMSLLAPASLYLTAILEHILSNVGRVVARDSSRASATVQDLYIALCEDHTIYGPFTQMKVYAQIEQLCKTPKVRRSKSLTKNERSSRTSSPQQDVSSTKEPSLEGPIVAPINGSAASRSSSEKTRTMNIFKVNSRSSVDDAPSNHRRTSSVVSDKSSKHAATIREDISYESHTLQQEFDDLMRSSSTMKVSLTPDRLKTMEAYKQEKERGNRRPVVSFKSDSDSSHSFPLVPSRGTSRPSLLRVDSIKEDEEELGAKPSLPTTRNRQTSVSSPPTNRPVPNRVRSASTSASNAASHSFTKSSYPPSPSPPLPSNPNTSHTMIPSPRTSKAQDPFPPRKRTVQRNRASLDLDDVMAGSGDDEAFPPAPMAKTLVKQPNPKRNGPAVSANTRDLIDFLAQGPPDMGGPPSEFTTDTSFYGSAQNGKPKGAGRLQRMISKLSLSNGERSRGGDDISRQQFGRSSPSQPTSNTLSSLANRPIPPRPPPVPRPISPPESPQESSEENSFNVSRSRSASVIQKKDSVPHVAPISTAVVPAIPVREHSGSVSSRQSQTHISRQYAKDGVLVSSLSQSPNVQIPDDRPSPISPRSPKSPTRKPAPAYIDTSSQPHISRDDAHHLHHLFSKATTADECRLIFDMFLARARISFEPKAEMPYPSPSPSVAPRDPTATTGPRLEASLLELFLGGEPAPKPIVAHPKSGEKKLQTSTLIAEPESSHARGNDTFHGKVFSGKTAGSQDSYQTTVPTTQEAVHFTQNHTAVEA
ncbi:hypothetical protein H0H93_006749 [Arthromyces matolae]|nr:hypothetical protein H0H93_006749 [Arthromyces matolae]